MEEKITPMLHSAIKSTLSENIAINNSTEKAKMNLKVGEKFSHKTFGEGKIKDIQNNGSYYTFKVKFADGVEKKMAWNANSASQFLKVNMK